MRPLDSIEAAIADIKLGKMIIVVDDESRENEGDFIMAADAITPEAVNFMATHGRGMICAPITATAAKKLDLPLQTGSNTAPLGTAFTVTVDAIDGVSTGISASDRAITLKMLANPLARPEHFSRPGHIFPLIARDGGVLVRNGHTEAAVDLARLAGFNPAGVICEILNDDGTMARRAELEVMAEKFNLKMISIEDFVLWRKNNENLLSEVETVSMPTKFGEFALHVFKSNVLAEEAMAIVKGDPEKLTDNSPLLRVHSECFTGDVLGSKRCDCGEQLDHALSRLEEEGSGIIVYLRQEGRGIGLMNKVRAYQLQDKGLDTVEANLKLGFPADARDYTMAAQILRHFKMSSARLMTNNPAKLQALKDLGAETLKREAHEIAPHAENMNYLNTKKTKLGHWLGSGLLNQ
ncbi:MAG: bifunctional 3,4-dihydroxy-2-butanone-4-phosphate synthase/GTP cyclohydrolase II [Bacteriovoracaceae bacterium]|nr:bifunctional 3,4-dihydroxy-2-butanone-4-phosphate synthase/GTP cyclohydrolase II [Bacteriovoracaceae bacterium]